MPLPDSPLASYYAAIDLLDRASAHTEGSRKEGGVTYTPPSLARAMVRLAQVGWEETVLEPSCGRGMFVLALLEAWLEAGKTWQEIAVWARSHLWVGDLDTAAVKDVQLLWGEMFAHHGVKGAYPGGPWALNAEVRDGLGWGEQRFDVVLGNPPYVRIQHLQEDVRERLRTTFVSCKTGNVDLYYAFFEDACRRAKRVVYIMPNSWFSNASARVLRDLVKPRLTHLIDFGSRLVFAPVRAYTAIAVVGPEESSAPIQVASCLPEEGGVWSSVPREDDRWGRTWVPTQARVSHTGVVLGDVARIASGIATLADTAFGLPSPRLEVDAQGQRWVIQDDPEFPGHQLRVPERWAPRCLKATKQPLLGEEGPRILCPYDEQDTIVGEDRLQREAPDLLAWLGRREARLRGRDKGKTEGYEAWYAYGRRQGFWDPEGASEVILVAQMGNGGLDVQRVSLVDTRGRFLFTSGFVVVPREGHTLEAVEGYLKASTTWAYVEREGKSWAGKGTYRSIGARALRQAPVFPQG